MGSGRQGGIPAAALAAGIAASAAGLAAACAAWPRDGGPPERAGMVAALPRSPGGDAALGNALMARALLSGSPSLMRGPR